MRAVDAPALLAGLVCDETCAPVLQRLSVGLEDGAALGGALAEALEDPSLEIAYWISHLEGYVDCDGRHVELPGDTDSGRAVTSVQLGERRIVALVHGPSLLGDTARLDAVAAFAAVALERERSRQAARQRVAHATALLNATPDLLIRMSRDGTYLHVVGELRLLVDDRESLVGSR